MAVKGSKRLNDGYATGIISPTVRECSRCGEQAITVYITDVRLPEFIKPGDRRIILQVGDHLGISCGCYARASRQIAHILSRKKNGGK